MIRAVLYDFGGVLAEEGFREAIMAVGRREGKPPERLFRIAEDLIYETGYLTGEISESDFWAALRGRTSLKASDDELRKEVLRRFIIRPEVLHTADEAREAGFITGILSDQTGWLEELDARMQFTRHFDHVFNSFRMGKNKRDASLFRDVLVTLGLAPEEVLFIDDKHENLERAKALGMQTIFFDDIAQFLLELRSRLDVSDALKG